jgi:catechol 2,3-dioxygenase-like lactoylglutathione lyase family enzyme
MLDHIIVTVSDLAQSIAFYKQASVLGDAPHRDAVGETG